MPRPLWSSVRLLARDRQPVADAAHRLQIERIGGIGLDLAAQPVDLHVDGAFAGGTVARHQCQARYGFAWRRGEDRHDLALAVGEMDEIAAAAKLEALAME